MTEVGYMWDRLIGDSSKIYVGQAVRSMTEVRYMWDRLIGD